MSGLDSSEQSSPGVINPEVIRGILILIVIFDHNDIIRDVRSVNVWFLPMTVHVAGFLLLPFLARSKLLTFSMARDHAIRYLVPFFWALLLYSIAFKIYTQTQTHLGEWFQELLWAFVFADIESLSRSTGFIVLWFLPALLSVVLLIGMFNSGPRYLRATILVAALLVHLAIGATSESFKSAFPQGVLIALYIFPLGLAARHAMPWLSTPIRKYWVAVIALALLMASWTFERGVEVEVATLVVPTLIQPLRVIATIISDLSFLVMLIIASPMLARIPGVSLLGRHSLVVYLTHPLVYKVIFAELVPYHELSMLNSMQGAIEYWGVAAASVLIVTTISVTAALGIRRLPRVNTLLFPANFQTWLPVVISRTLTFGRI
jgi:fucose 4-O-acetylase-like acetyltransferase